MTSEGNRRLLELVVQIKNDFSGVDAIICCSTKMKSVHLLGTAHCAKLNMNKKTKQVPIQLPNIARTLFDAKKIIKKKNS